MLHKLLFLIIAVLVSFSFAVAEDTDTDGLDDSVEAEIGTDPADIDTDDDGFSDGVEVDFGSDPLKARNYPSNRISGFAGTGMPVRNYVVGLLVITILFQFAVFAYLKRDRQRKKWNF